MSLDWHASQVAFSYQLGDLTLFKVHVPMLVTQVGIEALCACAGLPSSPHEALPHKYRGYAVRSLPVPTHQPSVRRLGEYLCYALSQYPRLFIDMRLGFDAYRARFSSKTRSTITRKIKRFRAHCGGGMRFVRYTEPGEMGAFFDGARAVSALSYQERLLNSGLPGTQAFLVQMKGLAAADRVRGFLLFHGDRPVSYLYLPIDDGILIYSELGYDPAYRRFSVGTILHWLALESLFAEDRFRYFDFSEGASAHKRLFATDEVLSANLYCLRRSLPSYMLIYSHLVVSRASVALGALAKRVGIHAWARRVLRSFRAGSGDRGR